MAKYSIYELLYLQFYILSIQNEFTTPSDTYIFLTGIAFSTIPPITNSYNNPDPNDTKYYNYDKSYSIDPWWFTGFFDARGRINQYITPRTKIANKLEINLSLSFIVTSNKVNRNLINLLMHNFGGHMYVYRNNCLEWKVYNRSDLIKLRNHFQNYPQLSNKFTYFNLWSNAQDLLVDYKNEKRDFIILAILHSFPKGLSKSVFKLYPNLLIPKRSITISPNPDMDSLINGNWIAGFCSAKASFYQGYRYQKDKDKSIHSIKFQLANQIEYIKLIELIFNAIGIDKYDFSKPQTQKDLFYPGTTSYEIYDHPLF